MGRMGWDHRCYDATLHYGMYMCVSRHLFHHTLTRISLLPAPPPATHTHILLPLQACRFRDEYSRFTAAGAVVFGISSDSPADNAAFGKANNLPYPLVTDENSILRKVSTRGRSKSWRRWR